MVLQSSKSTPTTKQNAIPSGSNDLIKQSRRTSSPVSKTRKPSNSTKPVQTQPASQKKKKKKPKDAHSSEHDQSTTTAFHEPIRRLIKPASQLELSAQELGEVVTRVLTGDDPDVPKNVCKFSFKDKCYKPDPPGQGDNMATHFSIQGSSMHVDSEECKKYREREGAFGEQMPKATNPDANGKVASETQTTTTSSATSTAGKTMKTDHIKNQFNYSDRASQTFNNPLKSRGVHTEPPPKTQFSEQVTQWMIYDSYKDECIINMMEHKQDSGSRNVSFEDKLASIVLEKGEAAHDKSDMMHSKDMAIALKIIGRLVNQNAEDEIFQDFKYYEDKADTIKPGQGTLLPLWRFSTERTNRKQVTSLCWNPLYNDLFAVGYGSYEFTRQGVGMVCCYSLKNTSYPEYVIGTESGVMCLDFHKHHPSLLAVGCYDGTVSLYDIGNRSNKPIYSSSIRSGKHSDPIWQVRWNEGGSSKEMNFYSISSDGKVAMWTMSKNEMKMEPVMLLKLANNVSTEDLEETTLTGLAGGCSFDFNTSRDNLFLVGTEEAIFTNVPRHTVASTLNRTMVTI
eukprot:CCRYP_003267-RA/>CCRYP_003267-RA protein AED:0.31 eAED:0.31 QI:634/1/1/1/0.33/0/4/1214/565